MGRLSAQMGFETALFLSQSHTSTTQMLFSPVEMSHVMCACAKVFVVIGGQGKVWHANSMLSTHITQAQTPSRARYTHIITLRNKWTAIPLLLI